MRVVSAQILVLVLFQLGLIAGLTRCASDDQEQQMEEVVEGDEASDQQSQEMDMQEESEEWVQQQEESEADWAQESPSEEPAVDATLTDEAADTYVETDNGAQDAIAESLVQAIDSETEAPLAADPVVPAYEEASTAPTFSNEPSFVADASSDRKTYIVQKGDSLSLISMRIYGSYDRWRELASLNGIADANKIYPGDKLYYPVNDVTAQFSNAYQSLPRKTVTVQPGDTLASIASTVYRDSGAWRVLWRQNEGRISNPNFIMVGQQISYIPSAALASLSGDAAPHTAAHTAPAAAPIAEPSASDPLMQPETNIQEVIDSDSGSEE